MKKIVYFSILIVFFSRFSAAVYPYSGNIHQKVGEKAVDSSDLGDYLEENLGIKGNQTFNGRTAKQWVIFGSKEEDSGWRMRHHFHNPITNSGLNDFWSGESSRDWGTSGYSGNEWSWRRAQGYYYQALTKPTKEEREEAYAKMFQALGQVAHLIQDMAVPAHTRNDAHDPLVTGTDPFWRKESYEEWCKNNISLVSNTAPIDYSGIPDFQTGDFWDAEVYNGSFVPGASYYKGLAEFTNANFISEDTKFTNTLYSDHPHYQPHPTLEETDYNEFTFDDNIKEVQARDGSWHRVVYLSKDVEDQNVEHFVQAGYFPVAMNITTQYYSDFELDERCHRDYADILIPKAVSYSAGLLNYFFKDEIQLVDIGAQYGYFKFHLIGNFNLDDLYNFEVFYDDENTIRTGGDFYWWNHRYGNSSLGMERISDNEIWLRVPIPYTTPIRYVIVYDGVVGKIINKVILNSGNFVNGYPGQIISKHGYVDEEDEEINNRSWEDVRSAAYIRFLNDDLFVSTYPASIGAMWYGGGNWFVGFSAYDAGMSVERHYSNLGTFSYLSNRRITNITIYSDLFAVKLPENIGVSISVYRASDNAWPPYWDCGDIFLFSLDGTPNYSTYATATLAPDSIIINSPNIWETKIPSVVDPFANAIPVEAPTDEAPDHDFYLENGVVSRGGFILVIDHEDL